MNPQKKLLKNRKDKKILILKLTIPRKNQHLLRKAPNCLKLIRSLTFPVLFLKIYKKKTMSLKIQKNLLKL